MAQRIPAIRQNRPLIAIKIRRVTARQPAGVQCIRAAYTVRGKLRIHTGCTEKKIEHVSTTIFNSERKLHLHNE